jgi:isocitrate/isopropylmalate dehydrogenase
LEWLGETTGAGQIRVAVDRALAARHLTPDVGGSLRTMQVTEAVVNHLE